MRFALEFEFVNADIPLDYRRKFLSFFKKAFENYDKEVFEQLFGEGRISTKPYTFSVYLGQVKFERDYISFKEHKKAVLNFSTSDAAYGILFYNSMLKMHNVLYPVEKNSMTLRRISLVKEHVIAGSRIVVRTLSPVIAREHKKERKIDNYFIASEEGFEKVLKENIEQGSKEFFDFDIHEDLMELKVIPVEVRDTKILHYGHKFFGSIGRFVLEGKPYLLDYLVKAGMGARRSQGFGMIEVEEVRE